MSSPAATACALCPSGRYQTSTGAVACDLCPPGALADAARTFCRTCLAGEFSDGVDCQKCALGKFAPQALSNDCLACSDGFRTNAATGAVACTACDPGKSLTGGGPVCRSCPPGRYSAPGARACAVCLSGYFAASAESSSCAACPLKLTSLRAAPACTLALPAFFLASSTNTTSAAADVRAAPCPDLASCAGGLAAPFPKDGYWVDRRAHAYAAILYKCGRKTCAPSKSAGRCWELKTGSKKGASYGAGGCGSNIQCVVGSHGPLCGSCAFAYAYRTELRMCTPCKSISSAALAALVLLVVFFAGLVVVASGAVPCLNHTAPVRFARALDRGSLKVAWVTYQIIMSTSVNLNVAYPYPFSDLLAALSFLTLDFVSMECAVSSGSLAQRYFTAIFLWSTLPLAATAALALLGAARAALLAGAARQRVVDQHTWLILLLSYLVLPPVVNRQFQALDW